MNEHEPEKVVVERERSSSGGIIAVVVAVLIIIVLAIYGLPYLTGSNNSTTNNVDVNPVPAPTTDTAQ